MCYDFGQLGDVFLLEPEMDVAETAWSRGELASTERNSEGTHETGQHGCVIGERKDVREGGDVGRLQGGMAGGWTPPEEAACSGREVRGSTLRARAEEAGGGDCRSRCGWTDDRGCRIGLNEIGRGGRTCDSGSTIARLAGVSGSDS